jgi:hypothetical protein
LSVFHALATVGLPEQHIPETGHQVTLEPLTTDALAFLPFSLAFSGKLSNHLPFIPVHPHKNLFGHMCAHLFS